MECRRTTAGCQGDPKDTAQSLTPSWDSFTLAGALELRPGRGGLYLKLRLKDRSFFTQVGGD